MTPATRIRPHCQQRGTVMVLALIIVTLVIVLVADATQVALMEREATRNASVGLQLETAMRGALEIAKAHLTDDQVNSAETDSLVEEWALPEGIEKDFDPEAMAGAALAGSSSDASEHSFPKVRIFIEDEERKWPLPWLKIGSDGSKERRREGLTTVLDDFRKNTKYDLDPASAQTYAERIAAFIARKEGDTGFGPTPRPLTKSGMPLHILDLGLIPGVPKDLVYRLIDKDTGAVVPGLMDVLTLWTDGRVNANTAGEAVMRALFRRREDDMSVGTDIFVHRDGKQKEYSAREDSSGLTPEERRRKRIDERAEREERGLGAASSAASAGGRPSGATTPEEEGTGAFTSLDQLRKEVNTVTDRIYGEISTSLTLQSKVFSVWIEAEMNGIRAVRRTVLRREGPRFVMILSEAVNYPAWRQLNEDEYEGRMSEAGVERGGSPVKPR
ncbi:MAG: hypothetical protein EXS14_08345 [Planctomycetes bacterium]|nr:hypothetical protein [Planctomycetota bacterium]